MYELRFTIYDVENSAPLAQTSGAGAQRNFRNDAGCWFESGRSYAMPSRWFCDIVHSKRIFNAFALSSEEFLDAVRNLDGILAGVES